MKINEIKNNEKIPFVRFYEYNGINFSLNEQMKKGSNIPDGVDLYPVEESDNGMIKFIGDQYGVSSEFDMISGQYGSGPIYVNKYDLPISLLLWCRANFLKSKYDEKYKLLVDFLDFLEAKSENSVDREWIDEYIESKK